MKKLKKENGTSQISLYNLGLLSALHGQVRFMLHFAPFTGSNATLIAFADGTLFRATGFTSGYKGESGLLTAIETYLNRRDITIEHISKWGGAKYLILSGKGHGQKLYHLDYYTEVW